MADSNKFAGQLLDALGRRRNLDTADGISMDELKEFWEDMTDQHFDSQFQIFFDMCDKNDNGKLSEDEVKEVIVLSASANKLAKLKENVAAYATLIMEELDPDHLGYIEKIPTNENVADILTKAVTTEKFKHYLGLINLTIH